MVATITVITEKEIIVLITAAARVEVSASGIFIWAFSRTAPCVSRRAIRGIVAQCAPFTVNTIPTKAFNVLQHTRGHLEATWMPYEGKYHCQANIPQITKKSHNETYPIGHMPNRQSSLLGPSYYFFLRHQGRNCKLGLFLP